MINYITLLIINLKFNTIGIYVASPPKIYLLQGHILMKCEDSQGFLLAQPGVCQEQIEEVLDLGQFIPEEVEDTNTVEEGDAVYDVEDEENEEDNGAIYEMPNWKTLYSPRYLGKRGGVLGRITKREEKEDNLSARANEGLGVGGSDPVWYSLPRGKKSIKNRNWNWNRISKRGRETEGTWLPYKRDSTIRCGHFPT